ncbi:molybdopterin-dependent oxidoreductase [Zavarzinella formosa]|uniref:molybdopterin-dependent oxidoreductase n=1 Tax=Zavarzinella formosa TaxID=360055 RepID=UPI0002ECE5EF|nr:molybdopterin-dependent oxidoreductase [Zavarzinella formosa]
MADPLDRREAIRLGVAGLVAGAAVERIRGDEIPRAAAGEVPARPFLTPGKDFTDVSRGSPVPHTLKGEALAKARLTPETWKLEIVAEDKATIDKPVTLDLPALLKLGETHGVRFLKAMQCNNIPRPLGQGLWKGVPLRDVLKLCGKLANTRRLFYWGFHNDKPEQIFKSSLAMSQVLDTPPGELPPFLAYKLNGSPISLERGGPVRMVVPWAHGFKSIKWIHKIILTNNHEANDTYAEKNNDPESYLKTSAHLDDSKEQTFSADKPVIVRGTAMVGWPGLERVEYWLRPDTRTGGKLAEGDPAWAKAEWKPGAIDPLPADWGGLPEGVSPKDVWGFTKEGKPREWPLRFSVAHWTLTLTGLKPGKYELRVRTVDKNGFAQPEPRPNQQSGKNMIPCKLFTVA